MSILQSTVWAVVVAISMMPATGFAYLLDTGEPSGVVSYDLQAERPLIAVEFTNSTAWDIDSVRAYFSISGTSNLQVKIWADGGNIPDVNNVVFESGVTGLSGYGWLGMSGLDWDLAPGTWWVGFTYASGSNAYWYAFASGGPDNPGYEAQLSQGRWYSMLDAYNFSLRIDEVPEPASLTVMLSLAGLVILKRRVGKDLV